MTLKDKNIIKSGILSATFASYTGNVKLYELWRDLEKKYGGYVDKINNNSKLQMKFTNDFFPLFKKAWREENDKLIEYIEGFISSAPELINTMKKHYYYY